MAHAPVVFISSTSEDLKEYREQARRAAQACGFAVEMMEDFPPSGDKPTLEACLEKVERGEVVVAIVAHRYGWVPEDSTKNPDGKSITWLECEHAWNVTKKEVLAFVVDPNYDKWPLDQYENYRLVKERSKPGIREEVERNEKNLEEFKSKLGKKIYRHFTEAQGFRALVSEALLDWSRRHAAGRIVTAGDPDAYLKWLEEETRQIRIKGLTSRRAEPYFFGIEEIYIPLKTLAGREETRKDGPEAQEQRRVLIQEALTRRNVVLIGDPGSGKSTFLRRVAFELCRAQRGTQPAEAGMFLAPDEKRFPIWIRVADLAKFLGGDKTALSANAPEWVPRFMEHQSQAYKWGVSKEFFDNKLSGGECLILVDGLDEAPGKAMRERIARIFEQATRAYSKCDFLVSTRPQSYAGDSVLAGFHPLKIDDLGPEEIAFFFDHFARALALTESESEKFKAALSEALDKRREIRVMARNPVMLTALAVLQHNGQRLPEYRVELYASILGWLAAAREDVEGRPKADACLQTMRKLALRMQDAPEGRLTQWNKRLAAEFLKDGLGGTVDAAEEMLEREMQDSGIIASAGTDLKFWHLSFQEYLAAREIVGFEEKQILERVIASGKLYLPEWREVMRLLGGLLKLQGEPRIDWLIKAILEGLGERPKLAVQARCAGLLGAMMRDLEVMRDAEGKGYRPAAPEYERTIKAVERIFEAGEAEKIDFETRLEAADALGLAGDPRLDRENRVAIPAATFWMGAQKTDRRRKNFDPEAYEDEAPVHQVDLRPFWIGKYPVTVQEFGEFIRDGGYQRREYWRDGGFGEFNEPDDWDRQAQYQNCPVTGVSWFEASAYCAWKGCRLPTEAEWERAARGAAGGKYPWGNEPPLDPSRANYDHDKAPGRVTPVGLYPTGDTSDGVCDILGNVWEWCGDWYGHYQSGLQNNPRGPDNGKSKVLRGGSWGDDPWGVRVSDRNRRGPTYRNNDIGFRCAGDLS